MKVEQVVVTDSLTEVMTATLGVTAQASSLSETTATQSPVVDTTPQNKTSGNSEPRVIEESSVPQLEDDFLRKVNRNSFSNISLMDYDFMFHC